MPIVSISGDPIRSGFATSFAHPDGNITGVTVDVGVEIWGKRLQLLKETVPSASKVGFLELRTPYMQERLQALQQISGRSEISLVGVLVEEATPSECQRAFAAVAQERPDGIMVAGTGELRPYRQLIVELVEKSSLPAIYGARDYMEVGGLMSYEFDQGELGRRLADDVRQILNRAKPGDIPIYQATRFELLINLKTAKTFGLTLPPTLLTQAAEIIE